MQSQRQKEELIALSQMRDEDLFGKSEIRRYKKTQSALSTEKLRSSQLEKDLYSARSQIENSEYKSIT